MKRLGLVTLVLALGCGGTSSNNTGPTGPTGGYADSGQRDGGLDSGHDGNGQKPDANSRQDGGPNGNSIRDSGLDGGTRDSESEDSGWDSSGSFDAQYDSGQRDGGQPDANDFDGGKDSGSRDGSLDASVLNHYPTVELSASKTTADRNEDIAFTANGQDSDGDSLFYRFYTNEGQTTSPNTRNNTIFAFTNYGTFTVGVDVNDRRGGTASDSLDVLIEDPNRLYVNAGPDMTLDRDKKYCFNFTCDTTELNMVCSNDRTRVPFASGHSEQGFPYGGNIVEWKITGDSSASNVVWNLRDHCMVNRYLSVIYPSGSNATLRVEVKDAEGNIAFDEANISLR